MWILAACSSTVDIEGDGPDECRDGADNNQDGYFDCQDQGCWGSPDCGETDGDADTDADSDADSDTEPNTTIFTAYALEMQIDWLFTTLPSCTTEYAGAGTPTIFAEDLVTFDGTYGYTADNCDASLDTVLPWVPDDGTALVTFGFGQGLSSLDVWFADEAETERYERADWYMFDMFADFDPADPYTHHEEQYNDPGGSFIVYYSVDVVFDL